MTRTRQKHQQRQARAAEGLPTSPGRTRPEDVFVIDPQRVPGRWQWPPNDPLGWLRARRGQKKQETTMDPINAYALRDALRRSTDGQSGKYVYAAASADGRTFRITGYKNHRGLHYGYELNTGKWVVIGQWEER